MANAEKHFHEILKKFDTAMLVSRAQDGSLHARPMAIANIESDSDVWFATSAGSGKVDEILADPEVVVTLQSSSQYLSLSGSARLSHDRAKIDEFWNEAWKVWFPKGKSDPSLALLKVSAERGEYWDNSGMSGLKYAFEAGKAYLQGERPKTDKDVNQKVQL